jgi:hypothetical protein
MQKDHKSQEYLVPKRQYSYRKHYILYFLKNMQKNYKKPLHLFETSYIIANVVTLIALKREVAVEAKAFAGFPWSECQVVKTGDKSLYEYTIY